MTCISVCMCSQQNIQHDPMRCALSSEWFNWNAHLKITVQRSSMSGVHACTLFIADNGSRYSRRQYRFAFFSCLPTDSPNNIQFTYKMQQQQNGKTIEPNTRRIHQYLHFALFLSQAQPFVQRLALIPLSNWSTAISFVVDNIHCSFSIGHSIVSFSWVLNFVRHTSHSVLVNACLSIVCAVVQEIHLKITIQFYIFVGFFFISSFFFFLLLFDWKYFLVN